MDLIQNKRKLKKVFRESSNFNNKYANVLGAEKSLMKRELFSRQRSTVKNREKLMTPMAVPKSSFFKLFGNGANRLPPSELNKTTYVEIFNSTKNSLRKNLNYINYTKHDHDVITNGQLSSAYSSFRNDLFNYQAEKPDPKNFSKRRFLNRSPPGSVTDKKHIKKNIRHIRNLSDLHKIKILERNNKDLNHKNPNAHVAAHQPSPHKRNNSNFVFFKRKNDNCKSRRFNEGDANNLTSKVV
jgi:hypothetical protein